MKKCRGCGEYLQTQDPTIAGYVLNDNQEYCQRCFRLIHYGDIDKLNNRSVTNIDVLKIYNELKEDVFVLIVDGFDALILDLDNLLDTFKKYKVILVINKIDLLPRNVKDDKLEDLYTGILKRCNTSNLINCLLTYKGDSSFNDLFFNTIKELKDRRFVFAGRANAGKSTIINKLLKDERLTTSSYPGTTLKINEIEYDDYKFIDTPGLIDDKSFVTYIETNKLKYLSPLKCIKPKVYQLYEPQSYFVEGLLEVDIKPNKQCSISFVINNDIEPHRTKLNNAEYYLNKHQNEFKLKLLPFKSKIYSNTKFIAFYLKGLGYIKIQGECTIDIKVNDKIKVYRSEVNI